MDTVDTRRTKDASIEIRLLDAEKASFRQCADLSGLSLSSWIRVRLRESAIRELKQARKPVRFLEG